MSALLERLRLRKSPAAPAPPPPPRDTLAAMEFLSTVERWEGARLRAATADAALAALRGALAGDEGHLAGCRDDLDASGTDAIEPHFRAKWEARVRALEASVHGRKCALVPAQAERESAGEELARATAQVACRLDDAEDASRELELRSILVRKAIEAARIAHAHACNEMASAGSQAANPGNPVDLAEGMAGDRVGRARAAVATTKAALLRAEDAGREQAKSREAFERCLAAALAGEARGGRPR